VSVGQENALLGLEGRPWTGWVVTPWHAVAFERRPCTRLAVTYCVAAAHSRSRTVNSLSFLPSLPFLSLAFPSPPSEQWFWFIPGSKLWKVTYTRQQPLTAEEVQRVVATDGPNSPLPGAFPQQTVQSAGTGVYASGTPRWQCQN
jgi:hypothetical protein